MVTQHGHMGMAGEPYQQVLLRLSETHTKVPGGDGLP